MPIIAAIRQSRLTFLVCGLLLCSSLVMRPNVAFGQTDDGVQPGIELPDGVTFDVLAEGVATNLPAAPVQLRLDRLQVNDESSQEQQITLGPELYYVETGSLGLTDELGIEGTYQADTGILIPAGIPIVSHLADGSSLLRLGIVPVGEIGGSQGAATPVALQNERLFDTEFSDALELPATLFIARLAFEPGALLESLPFTGAVGIVPDDGEISIMGPSGIEGILKQGLALPPGSAIQQRNASSEPASVLIAGIIPVNSSIYTVPTTQSIPESPSLATPTATVETPQVMAAPGVLYEATADGGFENWPVGNQWKVFRGTLVSDGTSDSLIIAPVDLEAGVDFALEAEVQILGPRDGYFGLNGLVSGDQSGVRATIDEYDENRIYVSADKVDDADNTFDNDWHTYRLEVRGNEVWLYIDGTVIDYASDNRLLSSSGNAVGLYGEGGMQLNVRRFTVYDLSEAAGSKSVIRTKARTVLIGDGLFNPPDIEISAGTTVTWTSMDEVPHTVTSTDGVFQSDRLDNGDTFSFTFDTPGLYAYYSEFDPDITGSVLVV